MSSTRPPRGLNTTIRCSTCQTPIPLTADQAEALRLALKTHAACAVCGMSGEYSLLGGRPTRRAVAEAPPASPPPFAPLPTAADRANRAPAVVPHFAPAALPTPAAPPPPPPAAPYFSPVVSPAPVRYQGPRRSLNERWKSLSKGRQWAVTVALVVVAGAIVMLIPTDSGHPPADPARAGAAVSAGRRRQPAEPDARAKFEQSRALRVGSAAPSQTQNHRQTLRCRVDRQTIYGQTLRHLFAPVADLLYQDESVTEVLINGPDQIYCERAGRLEKVDRAFAGPAALLAAVRNLSEFVHRSIGDGRHSLDARLPEPEKFRVHVIVPPASRQGVCVSIRKFRQANTSLDWLTDKGSLSPAAAEYLRLAVRCHRNLVVSGGTGSGKTSLLNALSAAIPDHERIVVIEDSSELRLIQSHTVYLEAQPAGPDGKGAITIRDLFVDSLRMRPDRIVVGEVRRGEALDLIQSMLSGHDGALSTVHASSPMLALVRLETLCLMNDVGLPVYVARTQVASAIHVIAQLARLADGSRRVVAIAEAGGLDDKERYRLRPIFRFRQTGREEDGRIHGSLEPTGRRSRFGREVLALAHAGDIELTRAVWEAKAS